MTSGNPATNESQPAASASENEPLGPRTSAPSYSRLFGRPQTLISGENTRDYEALSMAIADAVKPADIVERIWENDFTELVWEGLRLRRLKTQLLASTLVKGLGAILASHWDPQQAEYLARQWAMGDRSAKERVDKILHWAGMTIDAAMAQALAINIDAFERIDTMIQKNEGRRNATLREIERHRATLGQQLRTAVQHVEDAEFKVVEPDRLTIESAT